MHIPWSNISSNNDYLSLWLYEFHCLRIELSYKNKVKRNWLYRELLNRLYQLKRFYSFKFSVKNGRWDTITVPRSVFMHIIWWLDSINLSESCKKSNGVSAEKIQRFVMAQSNLKIKRDLLLFWNRMEQRWILLEK